MLSQVSGRELNGVFEIAHVQDDGRAVRKAQVEALDLP